MNKTLGFIVFVILFITQLSAQEKFPVTLYCENNIVIQSKVAGIKCTSTKIPIIREVILDLE